MTDKEQIIIDGVNIAECEYHYDIHKTMLVDGNIKTFKNYCQINNDGCYGINCYFKQLARKEQECEQLNKRASSLGEIADNLQQRNHHLTQECEELKEKIRIKDDENSNLNKKYRQEQAEKFSYRKALEEIEEVIKTPCTEDCVYYELSRCYDCIKTSILDIINRAKGTK